MRNVRRSSPASRRRGHTLIEVLVVVAVIAIVAAIVYVVYLRAMW